MHKSIQIKRQHKQPQFVKGMTLDQYLASYPTFLPTDRERQLQQKQENLQETSHYGFRKRLQSKASQYKIEEIDQESMEDSIQYHKSGKTRAAPFFEELQTQRKQTNFQDQITQQNAKNKRKRISLNSRENLKHYSEQKNGIRIKKISMSPGKRRNDEISAKGSITQYGNKFKQPTKKETLKMTEILTFYGKLSIDRQQQKMKQKNTEKNGDVRHNFKKKNQLELKELLAFQNRIKINYSCGSNYQEMMVLGVKDKLNMRKQKHFQ